MADLDVKIWVDSGKLRCNAPEHVMTPELKAELASRKQELLEVFGGASLAPASINGGLPRRQPGGDIPLSPSQERIWTLSELRQKDSTYNISTAFRIRGALNIPVLEKSLNELQRRHEILRTCFPRSASGKPRQEIFPEIQFLLPVTDVFRDMRRLPPERQEKEAQRLLFQDIRQPFDLKKGPVWRVRLLKLKGRPTSWWRSKLQWYTKEEYILSITMHHIIFDGSSKYIFLRELSVIYNALCVGEKPVLREMPIQYADFAQWQSEWLQGEEIKRQLTYWRGKFVGELSALQVPADHPWPSSGAASCGNVVFELPEALAKAINAFSREERTSMYATLLSAFYVLLNSYTGQERLIVSSPLASRSRAEVEGLIGYFNNIVPMLADLSGDPSFRDLIGQVRRVVVEALENQNVPLQKLSELQGIARIPLNRGMFSYQDTSSRTLDLTGVSTTPIDIRKESADFDLAMYMEGSGSSLGGILEYNADILDEETISQLLKNFQKILEHFVSASDKCLSSFPVKGFGAGDIEKVLTSHPKIDRAVVVRRPYVSGWVAYLVLNEHDVPNLDEVRDYARKNLPAYSVPDIFVPLDEVPFDPNGAVDLLALPQPGRVVVGGDSDFEAPRTALEQKLAGIWKKVLWLEHEVGIHDHFLELGGHSLLSVQLVLELEKELGRRLPESVMTQLSTVAGMALLLEQNAEESGVDCMEVGRAHGAAAQNTLPQGMLNELRVYTASWTGARVTPESIIVGLNTDGTKQAIFWCLQRYQELTQLAKYLGSDQPIFGMRSGNRVMVQTPENVRALAEYYANEIMEVQPVGPYLLGGNCQAASIAFQVAVKLREMGCEITLLILHERFVPQPYPGKVALTFGTLSNNNPYSYYINPEQGWGKYYPAGVTIDIVPGSHGQFFREPNIQVLAANLRQRIEESQDACSPVDLHRNVTALERLPERAYRARVSAKNIPIIGPGEEVAISVTVENHSSVIWPSSDKCGVFVSSRWLNSKGKVINSLDPRTALLADLAPGASVAAELTVRAPSKAGQWILELDMVEEGIAWFGERGSARTQLNVNVRFASGYWTKIIPGLKRNKSTKDIAHDKRC